MDPFNTSAACPAYVTRKDRYFWARQAAKLSSGASGDAQCLAFCTTIPTYTFTAGKDSAGGNIYLPDGHERADGYVMTAKQLAALCDRTDGCVGFNTVEWLKRAIKAQLDPWPTAEPRPCDGLFVKQSAWEWVRWAGGEAAGHRPPTALAAEPAAATNPLYPQFPTSIVRR